MTDWPLIDLLAVTALAIGLVRGVWIGLIREGLSLAAIALCAIVTRLFVDPVSIALGEWTGGDITGRTAVWIAGVLLVVATILACGLAARLMRTGARFAGLGWADRLGGGALGLAEGTIVAVVLVTIALWLVGPEHPATIDARSVELVEEFRNAHRTELDALGERLPAVAAPGDWFDASPSP